MAVELALEIRLLGGFETRVGTQTVLSTVWRQRRAAAIVKLLALDPGHRLHREQLLETLWPELDPGSAANNLRGALHLARQGLEGAGAPAGVFLVRDGDQLLLGPRERLFVDVAAFTEAASRAWQIADPALAHRAAALYAGELLPDDPYEDWAAARREGLRASYLTLLTRLAGLHEERGELAQAVGVRERILVTDPLDETAHAALMRLHARMGQPQRALAQYAQLHALLERELGTAPDAATQALAASIRDARLEPALPSRPTPPAPQPQAGLSVIAPGAQLPAAIDDLLGRDREVAELERLLGTARLVTLTGAGGIGKTRLAQEAARASAAQFPDGVAVVDLAPLRDPTLVLPTVARALGVDETGNRPINEALATTVGETRLLLVLDNFEQLTMAGPAVAALLAVCPHLTLLTTSRIRLGVRGEQEYPVLPLRLPERVVGRPAAPLAEVAQVAAIALFARRAVSARPGFTLTDQNVEAVVEICRRLDGLPLAIELAAAQVRVLAPVQLLQRLERPLDVLGTTAQDVPARQRTLRATIAWSYDLLSPPEQVLFRRLSLFVGGWSLEATEAMASIPGDTSLIDAVETLGNLIDHSLVETRSGSGDAELRYSMLETIREFASERLTESDEAELVQRVFTEWLIARVERAQPGMQGQDQSEWLDRLDAEHDNLRAVLDRARQSEDSELMLRLAVGLRQFWHMRGYPVEGRTWLERALAGGDNAPEEMQAEARQGLGRLAFDLGNYDEAHTHYEASLALYQSSNDRGGIANALTGLGIVALNRQEYADAQALNERALAIRRELGDKTAIAWSLYYLGVVARESGDQASAGDLLKQSRALWRELGDEGRIGATLVALGMVSRFEGDAAAARSRIEEGLVVLERIGYRFVAAIAHEQLGHVARLEGDDQLAIQHYADSLSRAQDLGATELAVENIEFLACVATALGQPVRAGRLFGAAAAMRSSSGLPPPMDSEAGALEEHMAEAKRAAKNAWARAWEEGQALSLDQAAAEARGLLSSASGAAAAGSDTTHK